MKKLIIIAKLCVPIIPLIFYFILLKIIPEIRGNGPQVYERQLIRLLIPCILYSMEYILISLVCLIKIIIAFEDKANCRWFRIANMVKCIIVSVVSIAITRYMLFDVPSRRLGEHVLCFYVLFLVIIEIVFILYELRVTKKR